MELSTHGIVHPSVVANDIVFWQLRPNPPVVGATRRKRRAPEPERACQAWHRTSRVQVPAPGIGGAEG